MLSCEPGIACGAALDEEEARLLEQENSELLGELDSKLEQIRQAVSAHPTAHRTTQPTPTSTPTAAHQPPNLPPSRPHTTTTTPLAARIELIPSGGRSAHAHSLYTPSFHTPTRPHARTRVCTPCRGWSHRAGWSKVDGHPCAARAALRPGYRRRNGGGDRRVSRARWSRVLRG